MTLFDLQHARLFLNMVAGAGCEGSLAQKRRRIISSYRVLIFLCYTVSFAGNYMLYWVVLFVILDFPLNKTLLACQKMKTKLSLLLLYCSQCLKIHTGSTRWKIAIFVFILVIRHLTLFYVSISRQIIDSVTVHFSW